MKFEYMGCTNYNKDHFINSERYRKMMANLISRNCDVNVHTTYNAPLNGPYAGPYTFTPIKK